MRKSTCTFYLTFILIVVFIGCNNDDNSASRSTEEIKVILDNGTPQFFSNNILAKEYPTAPTSGFSCEFKITSEDTTSNQFIMNLGEQVDPCPFTVTTPLSNTLSGPVSAFLVIPGVIFDDAAANSLNFTISTFGNNTGDDIDISISGTYFEVSDPTSHSLSITLHVHRD